MVAIGWRLLAGPIQGLMRVVCGVQIVRRISSFAKLQNFAGTFDHHSNVLAMIFFHVFLL
jgi:hypothetical protein